MHRALLVLTCQDDQTTEWMPGHVWVLLVGIRDNLQDLMANGPGCNELEA